MKKRKRIFSAALALIFVLQSIFIPDTFLKSQRVYAEGLEQHELDKTGWIATASDSDGVNTPDKAIDGDIMTKWSTGKSQADGQWFMVDMREENTFSKIVLDEGSSSNGCPRSYKLFVSKDGIDWGSKEAASGKGAYPLTEINLGTVKKIRKNRAFGHIKHRARC